MRSPKEILFRLKQEAGNAWCAVVPPSWHPAVIPALPALWPDGDSVAAALRDRPFAIELVEQADRLLAGELPLLGYQLRFPDPLVWNKDLVHGQESPVTWFRRLPYLDFAKVGDHKVIWELSRHQYLMVVTQAWLLRKEPKYLDFVARHLDSWLQENPYGKGINWTSALEVAFRALSWLWILHWTKKALPEALRRRLLDSLYGHGLFLELNLSHYFSPNTHLLGEAIALYCLGLFLPDSPRAAGWVETGATVTEAELDNQVRNDGSHFEQSSSYHVYVVDFFLFYGLTAEAAGRQLPAGYRQKLRRSAEYLHQLLGPGRRIPLLGDDDGGRLFYPFGRRDEFGRATLSACRNWFHDAPWPQAEADAAPLAAWWFGPKALAWAAGEGRLGTAAGGRHLFRDAGVAMLQNSPLEDGPMQVIVDTQAFGFGGAGHSHAGALSLVMRCGETEVLLDSGTFTYISDVAQRNRFRGTAAHNTLTVGGLGQATPVGPFRWANKPQTKLLAWDEAKGLLQAEVVVPGRYRQQRTVQLQPGELLVIDQLQLEPVPEASAEAGHDSSFLLSWHFPQAPVPDLPSSTQQNATLWRYTLATGEAVTLALSTPTGEELLVAVEPTERSLCLGAKQGCYVLRANGRSKGATTIESRFRWDPAQF